jgi:hypothetical protein
MVRFRKYGILLLGTVVIFADIPWSMAQSAGQEDGGAKTIPLASVGSGNAVGVLEYCVANDLLPGLQRNAAQSTLNALNGHTDPKAQPGYSSGRIGMLKVDGGPVKVLSSLGRDQGVKICGDVLEKVRTIR